MATRKFDMNWQRMLDLTERERPEPSAFKKWLLVSPFTSWLFRDEKLEPLALAGGLAAIAFSVMAVWLASGHRGTDQSEQPVEPAPTEPAEVVAELKEDPQADVMRRVFSALADFAKIPDWESRLPFVRNRERVEPLMRSYYQTNEDAPMLELVANREVSFIRRGDKHFALVTAREETGTEQVPFIFEMTDGDPEFLIDWEILVNHEPVPWGDFVAARSVEPSPFRVRISPSKYYNRPFMDEEKYAGYSFTRLGNSNEINYAFVVRGSALNLQIERYLGRQLSGNRAMVLNLRFPDKAEFDNVLQIDSLVRDGWLGD